MKNALSSNFVQRAIIAYAFVLVVALVCSYFSSRTNWGRLPIEITLLGPHASFVIMMDSGFDLLACLIDLAFFAWFVIALCKLGRIGIILFGITWVLYGFAIYIGFNA